MKKLNKKKTLFSLLTVAGVSAGIMAASLLGQADNKTSDNNITLSVEKLDKETLKIALSDIVEVPKALQFSIEIDGNMTFDTQSINWLISATNNGSVQHDIKVSEDQKTIEFLLVSNEGLKKEASTIDIAEIDVVSKNNQATKYHVTAAVQQDGTAYKYVISDTNRQVSGSGVNLENNGELTYNTAPTLSLVSSAQVVEGKIMLTVGDEFTKEMQTSFVQAIDEEDGTLTTIEVEGNVDTSIVGSYSLTYRVVDSLGEEATLTVPVIVENKLDQEVENPVITGTEQVIYLNVGDAFDVLAGIEAVDYSGRQLEVLLSGDYAETIVNGKVTKAGTYTVQYDAVDRHGNVAPSVTTTLIVTEVDHPQLSGVVAEVKLNVGDSFDVLKGITAVDYAGNPLEVKVSGTYEEALKDGVAKKAGLYTVEYSATDSYGNTTSVTTTLNITEVKHPQLSGVVAEVNLNVGDKFDVLKGITAVDYAGNPLEVKVSGTYEEALKDGVAKKAGLYTIEYSATDKYGNTTSLTTNLIISEQEEVIPPTNPEEPDYTIPEQLKDLIDLTVMNPISGNGLKETPLRIEMLEAATIDSLKQLMSDYTVTVERSTTRQSVSYELVFVKGNHTHYLTLIVPSVNVAMINYLDSLIEDDSNNGGTTNPDGGGTTTPDEDGTNPDGGGTTTPDEDGTNPDGGGTTTPGEGGTNPDGGGTTTPDEDKTTPDNGGETAPDNGGSTQTPNTGIQVVGTVLIAGILAIGAGVVILTKSRKNKQ